jgi:hypothetical protein
MYVYCTTEVIHMRILDDKLRQYIRIPEDGLDQYAQWMTDGVCAYIG